MVVVVGGGGGGGGGGERWKESRPERLLGKEGKERSRAM